MERLTLKELLKRRKHPTTVEGIAAPSPTDHVEPKEHAKLPETPDQSTSHTKPITTSARKVRAEVVEVNEPLKEEVAKTISQLCDQLHQMDFDIQLFLSIRAINTKVPPETVPISNELIESSLAQTMDLMNKGVRSDDLSSSISQLHHTLQYFIASEAHNLFGIDVSALQTYFDYFSLKKNEMSSHTAQIPQPDRNIEIIFREFNDLITVDSSDSWAHFLVNLPERLVQTIRVEGTYQPLQVLKFFAFIDLVAYLQRSPHYDVLGHLGFTRHELNSFGEQYMSKKVFKKILYNLISREALHPLTDEEWKTHQVLLERLQNMFEWCKQRGIRVVFPTQEVYTLKTSVERKINFPNVGNNAKEYNTLLLNLFTDQEPHDPKKFKNRA
jgi:hypothetical protein